MVYCGLYCNTGNYHDCGYHRPLSNGKKMIPALTAVLLEAFTKGAALAVSVYLLWKQKEGKEDV